jgi:hypothetical protein
VDDKTKKYLIIAGAIVIAVAAFTYGALTPTQQTPPQPSATPPVATTPKSTPPKPTRQQLQQKLTDEMSVISGVLTAAYPKITTDYIISKGQLFDEGEWYGTTLSYRGSDTLNRDTLRVLMQKKNGVWILRTTPPQILLSTQKFPDVPREILQTVNQPVSLP